MSTFLIDYSDIMKEECSTTMLYDGMTLSTVLVYAQIIEESNFRRRSRDDKRRITDDEVQPSFNKSVPNQDCSSAPKTIFPKVCSQFVKSTCSTCLKWHFGKCIAGIGGFFLKDNHKVRDCTTVAARGGEVSHVPPNVPDGGATKRNHFYLLHAKANLGEYVVRYSFFLFSFNGSFYIW